MSDRWMTPQEAANVFGVSAMTVKMWALKGRLAVEYTVGGKRLFRESDVLALQSKRQGAQ